MEYLPILIILMIFCIGGGFVDAVKGKNIFDLVRRQPDVNEDMVVASGKITSHARLADLVKVKKKSLIKFSKNESHYMTMKCKRLLLHLATKINAHSKGNCLVLVTRAFASVHQSALRDNSLHYEGRALDLKIATREKAAKVSDTKICPITLTRFAWIARFEAKFDFVELKSNHIHVSCRKDRI